MVVKGMINNTLITTKGMGALLIPPTLAAVPRIVRALRTTAKRIVEADTPVMLGVLLLFGFKCV